MNELNWDVGKKGLAWAEVGELLHELKRDEWEGEVMYELKIESFHQQCTGNMGGGALVWAVKLHPAASNVMWEGEVLYKLKVASFYQKGVEERWGLPLAWSCNLPSTNAGVKKEKVIYKLKNVGSFYYCSWPLVTSFKNCQDYCLSPPQKLM